MPDVQVTNDSADSIWTVDTTSIEDTAVTPPQDTGTVVVPDTTSQIDTGWPMVDTSAPMEDTAVPPAFDPSGPWLLVANPSSQEFCGHVQVFDDQVLFLSVTNDGQATATLEPPEWFLTLNFAGTCSGMELDMKAEYTEEGPPSIGWATEHTHNINVTLSSQTSFQGNYIHELVPNDAAPCTRYWNITGTKQ